MFDSKRARTDSNRRPPGSKVAQGRSNQTNANSKPGIYRGFAHLAVQLVLVSSAESGSRVVAGVHSSADLPGGGGTFGSADGLRG